MDGQALFFNTGVSPVKERLQDGMTITVCGQVPSDSNRFQVDLQYVSDIVLHFNPRYEHGAYVVHNTLQNGDWGSEERKYENPFPRDQPFALQIFVTQESYKISTNGKPFSEYKHRLPPSHVNSICVGGQVEVNLIAFQYLGTNYAATPRSFMVPYKSIIHGGLKPGKAIIIQGVISHPADRLEINLRHKTGIAFYYSPRFDENVVVCNNYENGSWSEEEQFENMPFEQGKPFLVTIHCSHHHYEVFVSGKQTHTYNHHYTKLEDIDVLEISGDVLLSFVQP